MSVEQHGVIDVPGHLQAILSEVRSLQEQQRVMVAALDSLGELIDAKTPGSAGETLATNRAIWDCLEKDQARLDNMEGRLVTLEALLRERHGESL